MPYATLRRTKRVHQSFAYLHRVYVSHVYSNVYIYIYINRNISVYSYITTRCGLRHAGNDKSQEHHMTRNSHKSLNLLFDAFGGQGMKSILAFCKNEKYGMHIPCAQHWVTAWLLPCSHVPTSHCINSPIRFSMNHHLWCKNPTHHQIKDISNFEWKHRLRPPALPWGIHGLGNPICWIRTALCRPTCRMKPVGQYVQAPATVLSRLVPKSYP